MNSSEYDKMDEECKTDLKEIAHFYGGWKELRKVVDNLEDNEDEAAWERQQESDLEGGYSRAEESESMYKIQREIK
jgi:hypothetical protein